MLDIKFKVDKDLLAREIIYKSNMPVDLANELWRKYNDSYIKIQMQSNVPGIDENIIKELQQQPYFEQQLKLANKNLARIKNCWAKNKSIIEKFLSDTLRLNLKLNLLCYIVPPNLNAGHNIGNNTFVWGHTLGEKDANYDLVYLVHESLHSHFDKDNISHAIIEKISDIELSKFLNKSKIGYEPHSFTLKYHVRIFPFWNLYLNRTTSEIAEEQKFQNIQYNTKKFEKYRDVLSKMNIDEFIDFLKDHIGTVKFTSHYKIV